VARNDHTDDTPTAGTTGEAGNLTNDPSIDVHIEQRTADSDDDLNRADQRTPRGALLVPVDDDPDFVVAADVDPDPTPQVDGSFVRSHLVDTGRTDAAGNPVRVVKVVREDA
jgi:hypothetical protein